tara:strand:- start:31 stop:579 length:549 start_codon:yes stop_codon:yes gene_type:complete
MVNYNNGKIYKIECDTTGLIYVGSTTKQYLSQRLVQHRNCFNYWKRDNTKPYYTSFKVFENNNFTIVLLESANCNTIDELKARERFYIQSLVCVNKCIPLQTLQEYNEVHKEHITERNKEYYVANKEQIADKNKEWRVANKEQIADKIKVKFTCECGSTLTVGNKAKHCKTLKHLKYCEGSS